jgi:hypothetical protein
MDERDAIIALATRFENPKRWSDTPSFVRLLCKAATKVLTGFNSLKSVRILESDGYAWILMSPSVADALKAHMQKAIETSSRSR